MRYGWLGTRACAYLKLNLAWVGARVWTGRPGGVDPSPEKERCYPVYTLYCAVTPFNPRH